MQINPYVIFSDIHTEAVQAALAKHKEQKMALPMPTKRRSTFVQSPADACTPPGRFIGTFLFDSYSLGVWVIFLSEVDLELSTHHPVNLCSALCCHFLHSTEHSIPRPVHSTASFWIPALTGLWHHTHVTSSTGQALLWGRYGCFVLQILTHPQLMLHLNSTANIGVDVE